MAELNERAKPRESSLEKVNYERYYDFHWKERGGKIAQTPEVAYHTTEKTNIILNIIPQECNTIVDIGCGNGAITNALAERYQVTGLDWSQVPLKHLSPKASPVISRADHLPFRDECFDLAFSSELIEHLPDEIFPKAVSEMKRISRHYILITTPNNEKLRLRYTKCHVCGFEFHIYGHLKTFNLSKLARYFDDYTISYSTLCGHLEGKSFDIISYLKNKLGNSYFYVVDTQPLKCPRCGSILSRPSNNLGRRLIAFSLFKLRDTLNLLLNRKPEPDTLVVLFKKDRQTKQNLAKGIAK